MIVDQPLVLALRSGATGEQLGGIGKRERLQLEQRLTVDVEWYLAGAQHTDSRSGVENAGSEVGSGVDHVLAVVEDDKCACAPQPLVQRGFAAGDTQCGDQGIDDIVGCYSSFESCQPNATMPNIVRH